MSGIEGRYAVALFDLAEERSQLADVERDLVAIRTLLDESEEFAGFVSSPIFNRDQQSAVVVSIAKGAELGELAVNFLNVLVSNRRLRQLSAAVDSFFKLMSHHKGEVTAEVISANPLSDDQVEALREKLKAAVGSDVTLDTRVDDGLLGGLVVKVGSRMVDSSLKTKLQNLRVSMKGVG